MKKKEAYSILGLPETATNEEVKKAFKNKAKTLHPDINKDINAEKDFKQANEAYQAIENKKFDDDFNFAASSPFTYSSGAGGIGFDFDIFDFMNGFRGTKNKSKKRTFIAQDIHLDQTITFKESIIGCKKDITYTCDTACPMCNGDGQIIVDRCKDCNGTGRTSKQQGNVFFQQPCKTCRGAQKTQSCSACSETGIQKLIRTLSVSINSGITNNSTLRLAGMGNFVPGSFMTTDVLIGIKVIADEKLKLDINGRDVITEISITLLEALKGTTKEVPTIDGQQEIIIPALTKHKDEVIILNMGVKEIGYSIQGISGNERVMVNIEYPKERDKLITALESIGDE